MAKMSRRRAQWGDEGKGQDGLARERADIVCRFQGGHNGPATNARVGGEVLQCCNALPSGVVGAAKLFR